MTSENLLKMIMKPNYNILILGKGYVGNYLSEHLTSVGYRNFLKSRKELDYHDSRELNKFILNHGVNHIINCSGFTGRPNVDQGELEKEDCWNLNVVVPLNINKICEKLNVNYLHISTGCLYDGYDKQWSERDAPNFGLFQNHSSFYSKSKHAFENLSKDLKGVVLRIRMPFGKDFSNRNYFTKIKQYPKLLNLVNSKTYIPDLCVFVEKLLGEDFYFWTDRQIYNVVNPDALKTEEVCGILKKYGLHNSNWKFVDRSELKTYANRSNCVLHTSKSSVIHNMMTEKQALIDYCEFVVNSSKNHD
jgi:dTDP-4-dehydrorhamnose reductase